VNNLRLNTPDSRQKQQGFSLVMALGFMVFLTLIVLSMVNVTSSDEKIARNSRDKDVAFAAAEAALRDAEMYVLGSYAYPYYNAKTNASAYPTNSCINGLCDLRLTGVNLATQNFFDPSNVYGSNSNVLGYASDGTTHTTYSPQINGVAKPPRYLVEIVKVSNDPTQLWPQVIYRITAQAVGKSADTRVTLQELYAP
jgi:type IV pilus assembly protein PilX